jgi:hypothetical protein
MKKKNNLLSKFIKTISGSPLKTESLSEDGQYPLIAEEMITPVDEPIKTRNAIKVYKKHMLAIGYLEKTELSDFVGNFQEEMQEHEQHLKDEVTWAKETLAEVKAEAKSETRRLKKLLSKSKDEDEKNDLDHDMESTENDVASAAGDLERLSGELLGFKKDKRRFLVNYINTEVHGIGWKEQ